MATTVWGTFCNALPHYGLTFYCQGSSACSVFQQFDAVTCQSKAGKLTCSNGYGCAGATFTNDVYITIPANGKSAALYDTITRDAYGFNQSISIKAPASRRRSVDFMDTDADIEERGNTPVTTQVFNSFKTSFSAAGNAGQQLATSLANTFFKWSTGSGSTTAAALRTKVLNSIYTPVQSATNGIVSSTKQCNAQAAVKNGILSVNTAGIPSLYSDTSLHTAQSWILVTFVGHLIANEAAILDTDIAQQILQRSSGLSCSQISTTTSSTSTKISTSSTSLTTSKSVPQTPPPTTTSPPSTITTVTTKKPTTTSSISPSPSSTTTALSATVISASACPATNPVGTAIYNSTAQNAQQAHLESFSFWNSTDSLQLLMNTTDDGALLYDLSNPDALTITASNGSSLYVDDLGNFKYYDVGCDYAVVGNFLDASPARKIKIRHSPSLDRSILKRQFSTPTTFNVDISIENQCTELVSSAAVHLKCTDSQLIQQGQLPLAPAQDFMAIGNDVYRGQCTTSGASMEERLCKLGTFACNDRIGKWISKKGKAYMCKALSSATSAAVVAATRRLGAVVASRLNKGVANLCGKGMDYIYDNTCSSINGLTNGCAGLTDGQVIYPVVSMDPPNAVLDNYGAQVTTLGPVVGTKTESTPSTILANVPTCAATDINTTPGPVLTCPGGTKRWDTMWEKCEDCEQVQIPGFHGNITGWNDGTLTDTCCDLCCGCCGPCDSHGFYSSKPPTDVADRCQPATEGDDDCQQQAKRPGYQCAPCTGQQLTDENTPCYSPCQQSGFYGWFDITTGKVGSVSVG